MTRIWHKGVKGETDEMKVPSLCWTWSRTSSGMCWPASRKSCWTYRLYTGRRRMRGGVKTALGRVCSWQTRLRELRKSSSKSCSYPPRQPRSGPLKNLAQAGRDRALRPCSPVWCAGLFRCATWWQPSCRRVAVDWRGGRILTGKAFLRRLWLREGASTYRHTCCVGLIRSW